MKIDKKNKKVILSFDETKNILIYFTKANDLIDEVEKYITKHSKRLEMLKTIKLSLPQIEHINSTKHPMVPLIKKFEKKEKK